MNDQLDGARARNRPDAETTAAEVCAASSLAPMAPLINKGGERKQALLCGYLQHFHGRGEDALNRRAATFFFAAVKCV